MAVYASRRGRARRARGGAAWPTGFPEGFRLRIQVQSTCCGRLGAYESGVLSCQSRLQASIPVDWFMDDRPTLSGKLWIESLASEHQVPQLEPQGSAHARSLPVACR